MSLIRAYSFILVLLQIPLARYLNNVNQTGSHGRGVIPDHIVSTPIEDKLSDTDTQLNYVLDLIRASK